MLVSDTHYPLIYIPKRIQTLFYTVDFPLMERPKIPYFKEKDGWGSIFNTNSYIEKKKRYLLDCEIYKRKYEEYSSESKIFMKHYRDGFNDYKRLQLINNFLIKSSPFIQNYDYKEGLYNSYLKDILTKKFGEKIWENISVQSAIHNEIKEYYNNFDENMLEAKYQNDIYFNKKYKHYISDLAYINNEIKIIIELDEPYTLKEKKPIHFDDNVRNSFFLENGYTILRFCEEQVLLDKQICITILEALIKSLESGKVSFLEHSYANIAKIKKWTKNDAEIMIKEKFRENLIKKLMERDRNRARAVRLE